MQAGDYCRGEAGSVHQPLATKNGCLFVVISPTTTSCLCSAGIMWRGVFATEPRGLILPTYHRKSANPEKRIRPVNAKQQLFPSIPAVQLNFRLTHTSRRRQPTIAWYTSSTTIAPTTATMML